MVFRESAIIYDEELYSVGRKIEVARLIARKIAYQWFGNVVNPSWWSDAWMNEGIATLFGMDAINKVIFLSYF